MDWDLDVSPFPDGTDTADVLIPVGDALLDDEPEHSAQTEPRTRRARLWRVLLAAGTVGTLAVLSPRTALIALFYQLAWHSWFWGWLHRAADRVALGPWPLPFLTAAAAAAGALYTADRQPEAIPYLLASVPLGFELVVARRAASRWIERRRVRRAAGGAPSGVDASAR